MKDKYIAALNKDKKNTLKYYMGSYAVKTEQQKALEKILFSKKVSAGKRYEVADLACGAGSLSFHLSNSKQFKTSEFTLSDFNPEALKLAKESIKKKNFTFKKGNIYRLNFPSGKFDFVFCWQTLSWLEDPEKALTELIRITKSGGRIYLSSLFNLDFDVDIYAKVFDHTHGNKGRTAFNYNTYSLMTLKKWLRGKAKKINVNKFEPSIDFNYKGKGLGTFTVKTKENKRMQFSGGLLLNWAIIEIIKK